MSVTIYDIAEEAKVSIATVSRVFNDHPRVSEGTRQRVFSVAEAMGYRPHVSAQSLARQATQLISAVVPMLTSYFFMEVIRGVQARLEDSAFDLLVYASRSTGQVDVQLDRALQKGRADALLLCSTPVDEARARSLKAGGSPVVLVDSHHEAFDSISVDNRHGGFLATRHLLETDAQQVALIAADQRSVPSAERFAGYRDALREAGRVHDERLVVFCGDGAEDGYTREAGYAAMQQLLERTPRPDAVFVASDVQALGALKALRDAGLDAPADLCLVGFDDIRTSAYVGLTTVRQPMYEMGKLATERLLRRLDAPGAPPVHTVFAPELIVRETCGAASPSV